jgi:hypothetical protein
MKKLSVADFNTQPPHLYFGGGERRIIASAKDCQIKLRQEIPAARQSDLVRSFPLMEAHVDILICVLLVN